MSRASNHVLRGLDLIERVASAELRRFKTMEPRNMMQELFIPSAAPVLFGHGPNTAGKSPMGALRGIIQSSAYLPDYYRDRWAQGHLFPLQPREYRGVPGTMAVLGISKDQVEGAAWAALKEWLPPEFIHHQTKWSITLRRFIERPDRPGQPEITASPGVRFVVRTVEARRKRQQGAKYILVWADEEDGRDDVFDEFIVQTSKLAGWFQATMTAVESQARAGQTWFVTEVLAPAIAAMTEPRQREVVLDHRTRVVFGYRGDQIDGRTGELMTPAQLAELDTSFKRESVRRLRVDGEWDVVADRPYYADQAIEETVATFRRVRPSYRRGYMVRDPRTGEPSFRDAPEGLVYLFEEPDDEGAWVAGGDWSQGNARDRTGIVVWNRRAPGVSAVLHGLIAPMLVKVQFHLLCLFYNRAWAVPMADKYGMEVIAYLRDQRYLGRTYRRRTRADDDHQRSTNYGFLETSASRAWLDEAVGRALDHGWYNLRYEPLITEVRTYGFYGRQDRGGKDIGDHPPSGHDDLQKALGGALIGHAECPMPPPPAPIDLALSRAHGTQRAMLEQERMIADLLRQVGTEQGHAEYVEVGRWN